MSTPRMLAGALAAGAALGLAACSGPAQLRSNSGATASSSVGVSATDDPLTSKASPTTGVSARAVATPTSYRDKTWAYQPDPSIPDSGAYAKVPSGWAETVRNTYWSDFLDPTGQVRIRIDVSSGMSKPPHTTSPEQDADTELTRLRSAAGFKLVDRRIVPSTGTNRFGAAEIVYQATKDGKFVQVTYRFVGNGTTMASIGVYYPPDQQHVAESVLTTVQDSVAFGG